jgi:hypothetical protein
MGTYLGQGPFKEFSSSPTKDTFTGDGSTTTFDLGNEVVGGGEFALEVFIDNVRQEPGTGKAFTLGVDGNNATKRLTFASAPANGSYIYVINDKTNLTSVAPLQNDLNGTELVLDGDGDTSITADTDDRIDFRISDADHLYLGTSSGDTTFKIAADAKDIIFQQYDGRNILEINDAGYVALANGATGPGQLRLYEDTDNGTNYSAFQVGTQSGDITYTLPTADGSSGYRLETNGSGTLSWAAPGHITLANSSNNRVMTSVDSTNLNSEANLTFDGSTLAVTGAVTVSTNLDVDGTANLDAVDIDGAVQLDATLTIGADDQGYDVILYGDTASANVTWDTSADDLILNGDARIIVPDGKLVLGSTAVTSTAAELNLLDGVSGLVQADLTKLAAIDATAAEINLIDGGTARGTTAVASGDGLLVNDGGTMRMTNVDTVSTYFSSHNVGGGNIVTTGALDSGSITSGFGAIDNGTSGIRSNTITAETAFVPDASGGADLGTTSLEFNDAFFNDGAVINFGDDQDVTLTHVADTGLLLNSTMALQFNDASQYINAPSATILDINATDEIELNATLADVNANLDVSGTIVGASTISAGTAFVPDANDGANLGTSSLAFADSFFADGHVMSFGDDQDVTLTHVHNTGLLLNSTMAIQFNDASQYINAPSNAILDINATDEIELNATLVDVNANVEISGTASVGGVLTTSAAISGSTAEFSGAVTVQGAFIVNEDSADVDTRIESNGNTHMFFVDGGADHVNIGTSSDLGGVLNVNGTIYGPGAVGLNSGDYHAFTDNTDQRFVVNGGEEMRLEADGDLHVDGDVIAYSTTISDATLKYNINPVEFALDKVNQLKGCTFNYFKDGKESAGLLAQDVEKVMPSAVTEKKIPLHKDDDKSYKTLHYDSVTAILVEAIKELTAKVKKLEER